MEGYGWVIFSGVVVFFASLFVYLMFMIFLPEWVGITGAKALAAEASHRGLTPEELAVALENSGNPHGENSKAEIKNPQETIAPMTELIVDESNPKKN